MHMDPVTNAAVKEVKKQVEPPLLFASVHHEPSKPPMLTTFARSTSVGPAEWPPMCERGSQGTRFPLKRNREKKTGSHKLRTGAINIARSKCPAEFVQWAFASCDLDVLACSEALLDHDRAQELARELKTNGMKMHMSCLTEGGSVNRSVALCHSTRTEQDATRTPTGKEARGNVAEVRCEGYNASCHLVAACTPPNSERGKPKMESEATATCVKERKAEVQSMGDCFQVMGDIKAHTSLQARGNKFPKKKNTGTVMTTAASDMFLQDAIRFVHANVTLPTRRGRFNMTQKNDCQCGSDCYLRGLGDQQGNHCSHSTLDHSSCATNRLGRWKQLRWTS